MRGLVAVHTIGMGVEIGEGAVVGATASVYKMLNLGLSSVAIRRRLSRKEH